MFKEKKKQLSENIIYQQLSKNFAYATVIP